MKQNHKDINARVDDDGGAPLRLEPEEAPVLSDEAPAPDAASEVDARRARGACFVFGLVALAGT